MARRDALAAEFEAARQALSLLSEGPRPEVIAAQRAEVARAEVELAAATRLLVNTVRISQVSGEVNGRLQEPGDLVLPHTPIFTIMLDSPLYARVWAPEPGLGWRREGLSATILMDSSGRLVGRIGDISPIAESTPKTGHTEELCTSRVYELKVDVAPTGLGLRVALPRHAEVVQRRIGSTPQRFGHDELTVEENLGL